MKMKIVVLGLCLCFIAAPVMAAISGSAHDFRGDTGLPAAGDMCAPCHTPHGASTTALGAPLWNHTETSATLIPYASGAGTTMQSVPGAPTGTSKLCLGCHDGTVLLDAFGGNPGTASNYISASKQVGPDLTNEHPISFVYNTALQGLDDELEDPATKNTSLGGTIEADLLIGAPGSATMECASCHDVHDKFPATSSLLKIDNANSDLCLTCHIK